MSLGQMFDKSWKMIIKPPKIPHRLTALGPKQLTTDSKLVKRIDLTFVSHNNVPISAVIFYCQDSVNRDLVLYLHGNGGSKTQVLDMVKCVGKFDVVVAAYDFAGCGNSGEEYLTYGVNEVYDVHRMIKEVRKHISFRKVTLWGRSMGAVTSIMYAAQYPNEISSLVLDVPFRKLQNVVKRAAYHSSSLPKPIINMFLYFVKRKCQQVTQLDLFEIDYLHQFKKIDPGISTLFLYSRYDKIVPAEEVFEFYNAFPGKKEICEIYEDHEQDRKEITFIEGVKWVKRWNGSPNLNLKRIEDFIHEAEFTKERSRCDC